MSFDFHLTTQTRPAHAATAFSADALSHVVQFYDAHPRARPTPLVELPSFAQRLGVGGLMVKDESSRFGLNAFKITGVEYAVHRLLERSPPSGMTLACVSTGNHGRAVAHVAATRGLRAHVIVPAGTATSRVDAIAREGAEVTVSPVGYDEAVARLAETASSRGWTVVSDTSWSGYDRVPLDIMAGYTILLDEARRAWTSTPDVVIVQAGVGGLAAAVTGWFAHRSGSERPFIIVAEPAGAPCLLASARAGRRLTIAGALETHMAGLCCAEPSPLAWDTVGPLADAFVAVPDEATERAMRRLANPDGSDPPITAGSSGACGVATLLAIAEESTLRPVREAARLGASSRILAFVTEGITEPELYARVMAAPPDSRRP